MTSKTKTIWLAIAAAIAGYLSYIAVIPPSEQDRLIATIVAIFPAGARGEIGAILRGIAALAGLYATIHAAKSGPQTPPANPPQ